MHGIGRMLRSGLAATVMLGAAPACRKPAEAVKTDLGEAGYKLTVADWMLASGRDDVAALKKFIAAGFSVESCDASGDCALHAAASAGARNAADFLLARGLAIDRRGASGRTPLMAAVLAKRAEMVSWLLRQGADPSARDQDGYTPLMLAVREGVSGAVAELAPRQRDSLDAALLLAALVGQTQVIDTLTNYGASIYARMEDGRTPLMIAAENGHAAAAELLLDLGAGRFATDDSGRTAADLANYAGHAAIAALIARDPLPVDLSLESPDAIARSMDAFVDAAATEAPGSGSAAATPAQARQPSRPIQGAVLSAATSADAATPTSAERERFPLPPLVMRHYRERGLPIEVRGVEGESAILAMRGAVTREMKVRPGETVPGSNLMVVRARRRMESGKLNLGQPMEVSVVEVKDSSTGTTREWISGVPSSAHDPVALVEDAATGRRYTAMPGQRFKSADGAEFVISDVRPNQIVIEDAASGAVQTIPLSGPRG
jgi:ankyrin repeat protein